MRGRTVILKNMYENNSQALLLINIGNGIRPVKNCSFCVYYYGVVCSHIVDNSEANALGSSCLRELRSLPRPTTTPQQTHILNGQLRVW